MQVERVLSFDIPEVDYDYPQSSGELNHNKLDSEMHKLMQASCNGNLLCVQYSLKVFVRHDSKMQFGEGECITLPIRILERPVKYEPTQFETLDIFKLPQLPNEPASGFKTITNAKSQKYYEAYVKDWEQTWDKGVVPEVMTQDQLKEAEMEDEKPDQVEKQIIQAEVVEAVVEESPEMLEIQQPVEVVEEVVIVQDVVQPVKVVEEVIITEEVKEIIAEPVKEIIAEPVIEYTRLEREFRDIQENPIHEARVISDFKKANKEWTIKIKGPDGTPYEGAVFKFVLQFSANEPVCKFKSKIWHPQVREDGFGKFWSTYDESMEVRHLI